MTHDDPQTPDVALDDPIAHRLLSARPVPAVPWRGALRRRLVALGPPAARPSRLWLRAGAYAGGGLVLLALAAISVLGKSGPLAP